MPHVNKKFSLKKQIFSHINFSLSQKQRYEQKPLSFRSALHFCSAPKSLQIFPRVSFPASKITPTKLILKKGLLQYSSSSRKKTAPQYNSNSLNCNNENDGFLLIDCRFFVVILITGCFKNKQNRNRIDPTFL